MSTQTWYSAKDLRSAFDAKHGWTEALFTETATAPVAKANRAQVTTALDLIDIIND